MSLNLNLKKQGNREEGLPSLSSDKTLTFV